MKNYIVQSGATLTGTLADGVLQVGEILHYITFPVITATRDVKGGTILRHCDKARQSSARKMLFSMRFINNPKETRDCR